MEEQHTMIVHTCQLGQRIKQYRGVSGLEACRQFAREVVIAENLRVPAVLSIDLFTDGEFSQTYRISVDPIASILNPREGTKDE